MITKNEKKSGQMQIISMESLVPKDHILRLVDKYVDFTFIYDLVEDRYSKDIGRPSLDPVMLIKIPFIQYMFGIRSMRQTIKEIEVNVAYRWFLGLDFYDKVPHFSTFGKNYKRRFQDTDLFEQIFQNILLQCMKHNVVDTTTLFVDATHIKACANRNKIKRIEVAKKQTKFYEDSLMKEINIDREIHGKKPLKPKSNNDNDDDSSNNGNNGNNNNNNNNKQNSKDDSKSTSSSEGKKMKTKKISLTDPESGWFQKGEHKHEFAYAVEAACDKNGWILGFTIHPGNEHDSRTFPFLYEKLKKYKPQTIVMDAGYKIPAIAKLLIDDNIKPIFPYKRPMTKKEFFKKNEYVYDEYYNAYICPHYQHLYYSTTDRDGYQLYKSDSRICENCEGRYKCTESKNKVKIVTRHIWEDYMEICEEIRHTTGTKEIYRRRKETIERIFGTAKENHSMRYTQEIGKEKMTMKVAITFACLNIKKLVNLLNNKDRRERFKLYNSYFFSYFLQKNEIQTYFKVNRVLIQLN